MDIPPDKTAFAGVISPENPMGTDGFEFVEFTGPDLPALETLFGTLGFSRVARHRSKAVTLWRQGDVNFILNAEPDSFAQAFQKVHGPCACAMAFRVADARAAYDRAISLGAKPVTGKVGPMELNIPAIEGIGGSLLYFVDRYGAHPKSNGGSIYDVDFVWDGEANAKPTGHGLTVIDHLTHNVHRGRMDVWWGFYERLFNFKEIRYFDIEGKHTGLKSRALTSPCGQIRIPINESSDDKSQIEEYLRAYNGEGIQHIAMGTTDIFASVEGMKSAGIRFLDTPDTYYELLNRRMPDLTPERIARLAKTRILTDGAPTPEGGRLLQIFTGTVIGPIFFELIQREGDQGFGEGNFRALFESIELDQIRRGVLQPATE